jgi:hypothetical protein
MYKPRFFARKPSVVVVLGRPLTGQPNQQQGKGAVLIVVVGEQPGTDNNGLTL